MSPGESRAYLFAVLLTMVGLLAFMASLPLRSALASGLRSALLVAAGVCLVAALGAVGAALLVTS